MSFTFQPVNQPFPRWLGPFSPARGSRSGFRFRGGCLGTWVVDEDTFGFWVIRETPGVRQLADLVLKRWGGGRVLLLPDGLAIKPLQDVETGHRVVLGRIAGSVVLETPTGTVFDLSRPGTIVPGGPWPGPSTTGLECAIQPDGALRCDWYHPTAYGREEVSEVLTGPNAELASGFRKARPFDAGGRVRVTANGHVITNRQVAYQTWTTLYVGQVPTQAWPMRPEWVSQ